MGKNTNQNFNTTGSYSYTLESGQYGTLGPESVFIDVDLPSSELGCTITDDCHYLVWLPDVPNGTKIPVIADIGPYYDDGDVDALTPANRLGKFLIENMVPHGQCRCPSFCFWNWNVKPLYGFYGTK